MARLFKRDVVLNRLPTGIAEFNLWAKAIIAKAGVVALEDSQKFMLANAIMNLGADVDAVDDRHFVAVLRKAAANQVADFVRNEIREAAKARLAEQEKLKNEQVLAASKVQESANALVQQA